MPSTRRPCLSTRTFRGSADGWSSAGQGNLPVMDEVKLEAMQRHIELLIQPTARALEVLKKGPKDTNAILHVTC
jgi:hypothetical protein